MMRKPVLRLVAAWIALLAALALEALAPKTLPGALGAALIVGCVAFMGSVVALIFMEAAQAPAIARYFGAAGLLWLAILIGMGSLDILTRKNYFTRSSQAPDAAAAPDRIPAGAARR